MKEHDDLYRLIEILLDMIIIIKVILIFFLIFLFQIQ